MKVYSIICDLCGKEVDGWSDIYTIKVKSEAFVNFTNYGDIFADRKKIDLCKCCVADFKEYVQEKRQRSNVGNKE